jgi:Ca-activated chloride channel family protein
MRFLIGALILSANLLAQDPSFRVSARFVKVPVSVFDDQGRVLSGLTREDFLLRDEGLPRPISNFLLDRAPIHVLLLLDSSGSLRDELQEIKLAALRFAGSFSQEDRISVISFSDEVVVLQDWTNKFKRLKKSLKKLKVGYRTALYDALAETVNQHFRGVTGRRVIILLTDGLDNESEVPYQSIAANLISSDITLYIVSRTRLVHPRVRDSVRVEFLNRVMKNLLNDDGDFVDIYFREKEAAMRQLAEVTGGRVLFPEQLEDLSESYREVAQELKLQYVLTFEPPTKSARRFRKIELTCIQPTGRIHYRRQYSWP